MTRPAQKMTNAVSHVAPLAFILLGGCLGADPASEGSPSTQPGDIGVVSESLHASWHFGPYRFDGDPTDDGTCGVWATDTFDRSFSVAQNPDGTLSFVTDDVGTFVTLAGPSPDACDPRSGDNGVGHIEAGITGRIRGSNIVSGVHAPNFNPHGCDNDACQTCGDWAVKVLGAPNITVDSEAFITEYIADAQQALTATTWRNASPQYGGNHGDIRSTP